MASAELLYPDPTDGPYIIRERGNRFLIFNMSDPEKQIGDAPDINRAKTFIDEQIESGDESSEEDIAVDENIPPVSGPSDTLPGAVSTRVQPQPESVPGVQSQGLVAPVEEELR